MNAGDWLGGNPWAVLIRLVLISIVVGIVMSAMGLSPADLLYRFDLILRRLYDFGFSWIEWIIRYFLLGAVVVFPIWLIARLLGAFRKRDGSTGT